MVTPISREVKVLDIRDPQGNPLTNRDEVQIPSGDSAYVGPDWDEGPADAMVISGLELTLRESNKAADDGNKIYQSILRGDSKKASQT